MTSLPDDDPSLPSPEPNPSAPCEECSPPNSFREYDLATDQDGDIFTAEILKTQNPKKRVTFREPEVSDRFETTPESTPLPSSRISHLPRSSSFTLLPLLSSVIIQSNATADYANRSNSSSTTTKCSFSRNLNNLFTQWLQISFLRLGSLIASRPFLFVIAGILVTLICCVGLTRLKQEPISWSIPK